MRWLIFWLWWMLLIIVAAQAGSPSEWAKELQAISEAPFIFFGAFIFLYAFVILLSVLLIQKSTVKTLESEYRGQLNTLAQQLEQLRDDVDRKSKVISELREEIKAPEISKSLISEQRDLQKQNSQKEVETKDLKSQALELSGKIQAIVLKAKNKPTPKQDAIANYVKGVNQLKSGNIFANEIPDAEREKENIDREAVCEYLDTYYGEAQVLRGKVWEALPSAQRIGKKSGNSMPETIEEIQSIAHSLKTLATQLPD